MEERGSGLGNVGGDLRAGGDDPHMGAAMTDRLVYRVAEVCAMLGMGRSTFYRYVKTGRIPIYKLGSMSFVKREGLTALLESLTVSQPPLQPPAERTIERDGQGRAGTARDSKRLRGLKKVRQHGTA